MRRFLSLFLLTALAVPAQDALARPGQPAQAPVWVIRPGRRPRPGPVHHVPVYRPPARQFLHFQPFAPQPGCGSIMPMGRPSFGPAGCGRGG